MRDQEPRDRWRRALLAQRAYIDDMLEAVGDWDAIEPPEEIRWMRGRLPNYLIWRELRALREELRNSSRGQCKCAFVREDAENLLELLVPSGKRATGLHEIRQFTRPAKSLIVIDPYLYGGAAEKAEAYVAELSRSMRLKSNSLERLHLVFSSRHGNTRKIRTAFKRALKGAMAEVTEIDSPLIHDRIWIRNRKAAIVVGTSYGGLGSRASFILPLPRSDLESLLEYLQAKNLLSGKRIT